MKPVVATSALSPLHALIKDVCRDRPELSASLLKDYIILERMVKTRGLPVLLEDLPALGKSFDKGLSSGWFIEPSGTGTLRNSSIRFYCLISECFAPNGKILEDIDPNSVLYVRQLCYMYKKLKVTCPPENVRKTVEEFVHLDDTLRPPSAGWENPKSFLSGTQGDKPCFSDVISDDLLGSTPMLDSSLMRLLQRVADVVISTMPAPDWRDLIPRHGPGAVADLKTGSYKYDFPTWSDRLQTMFPCEYFTSPWGDLQGSDVNPKSEEVAGRLLAVPKTYSKPRLITAEPTANQYCQQAILRYLRESFPKVLRCSVNFFSQVTSRDLAKSSSFDGKLVTVDLSSASDLLSCWTVERMFRCQPELLSLLSASRTSVVTDSTNSKVFKYLRLRKFAGQGAAVTFPIQTIVYTIAAITAVMADHFGPFKAAGGKISLKSISKAAGKVRVFGDDIIIPGGYTLWYLERILHNLQLKINMAKTHHHGLFRESCGMDAYAGYEVTPVYLTSLSPGKTADSIQSWVDVSNSFHRNGYWNLSSWMTSCLTANLAASIPVSRSCDEYAVALHTFSAGWKFLGRIRFSSSLHRDEGYALIPVSRNKRVQGCSSNNLLQFFTEGMTSQDTFLTPTLVRWEHGHTTGKSLILKRDWVALR